MGTVSLNPADTGLEVIDLYSDAGFAARHLHTRDAATDMEGMHRLAKAFVEHPETLLQELVNAAVDICGADSAGISIQSHKEGGEIFYHWVATAGKYAPFFDAILPSSPSACGQCIERGRPQIFRVTQRFFDLMGVDAPVVTDGILIPWQVDETRGTIWIMSHTLTEAFDTGDCRMMEVLANFAAMAVRQNGQQQTVLEKARIEAAAEMANELAHAINNPLQSLTNVIYLAAAGNVDNDARTFAREAFVDLERLSALVKKLLSLPFNRS
jgi:transcriptional regulator with GAF, ATPase, and Fis domain